MLILREHVLILPILDCSFAKNKPLNKKYLNRKIKILHLDSVCLKSLFVNRGSFLRTTDSCFCFAKCGNTFHFPVFSWLVYLFGFVFVPTFDTKVTEYLCSGWVFFLQTNFDFLTSHFWRNFKILFERYCCPELNFEKIFHLWSFFVNLRGFKDCLFGQFGTINARSISRY